MEHERKDDFPSWLRLGLVLFDRAGFPALALIMMCYIYFVTVKEQTKAIEEFKGAMVTMATAIEHNSAAVQHMAEVALKNVR